MQIILNSAAQSIAGKCGEGYEVESAHPISFVAIASVRAATFAAMKDNSDNQTLLKARGSTSV